MAGRFFPTLGIHLGPTGAYASFIQNSLSNANLYPGQLGQSVEDNGNVYKLVNALDAAGLVTAAGDCVYYSDTTFQVVTMVAANSVAGANGFAGGTLGAITQAQWRQTGGVFVFIQIGGVQTIPTSSASTVAGDQLQGDGTNNKQAVRVAAGSSPTNVVFAIAMGSASGGNNAAKARWLLGQLLC